MKANFMYISRQTYYSYVNSLKKLFLIEDQRGWSPNIKSKTTIRTGNEKEFNDPLIALSTLHVNPESMDKNFKTF